MSLQLVNFGQDSQRVDVELLGLKSSPDIMTLTVLNGTYAQDENTFEDPYKVRASLLLLAAVASCIQAPAKYLSCRLAWLH